MLSPSIKKWLEEAGFQFQYRGKENGLWYYHYRLPQVKTEVLIGTNRSGKLRHSLASPDREDDLCLGANPLSNPNIALEKKFLAQCQPYIVFDMSEGNGEILDPYVIWNIKGKGNVLIPEYWKYYEISSIAEVERLIELFKDTGQLQIAFAASRYNGDNRLRYVFKNIREDHPLDACAALATLDYVQHSVIQSFCSENTTRQCHASREVVLGLLEKHGIDVKIDLPTWNDIDLKVEEHENLNP